MGNLFDFLKYHLEDIVLSILGVSASAVFVTFFVWLISVMVANWAPVL